MLIASSLLPGQARAGVAAFTNGGFETGTLAPWLQDAGSASENWHITSAATQSGSYAATAIGNAELRQSFTPILASTIAQLTFWIDHPDKSVTTNAYDLYYSDGTSLENDVSTSGQAYTVFDVTNRLNPAKSLTGIGIWGSTLGRTYLDSISITLATAPVPEVPSSLLLGGAVLTFGLSRRYRPG